MRRPVLAAVTGVAAFGLLLVLAAPAQASPCKPCKSRKLTPGIIASAKKWAAARGLPVKWVIATIFAESGGNPTCVGDCQVSPEGASVGLMQINTKAHPEAPRAQLFDPDTNIMWGTKILREAYDRVQAALSQRPSKVPIEKLVRLQYRGVPAASAVVAGRDPSLPYLASLATWDSNLVQASALV